MFDKIRGAFLQNLAIGLLTLLPLFGTFYLVAALLNFSDNFLFNLLPLDWQPHNLFGFHIPGLGIALTVLIIFGAGVFTRNFLGKQVYSAVERLIQRVPVMNGMYSAFRQLTESIFMDRKNAFRKVVLVEFPQQAHYSLGFVAGLSKSHLSTEGSYKELYSVFVPTAPNPTSGFLMIVPDWAVHDVDISVQEAFRIVVSGGLLAAQGTVMERVERSIASSINKRKSNW
jgi:uncharacterized membrane protein